MKQAQVEKNKVIVVEEQNTPVLSYTTSIRQLNDGMLALIDLGEFARVFALARKYGYFNTHGALVYALISLNHFALAVEALMDLLEGPLFNTSATAKIYAESLLVKIYEQSPNSFDRQSKDYVTKIDSTRLVLKISPVKLAVILQSAIARQWPINDSVFGTHFNRQEKNTNKSAFDSQEKISQTIFQQALVNIEGHINGESYKQYRHQLLKTDFNYIRESLSKEAVRELAVRCGLYDFHPWISWNYYSDKQYLEVLDVLSELFLSSDITKKQNDFYFERLRDFLRKIFVSSLSKIDYAERLDYAQIIKQQSPEFYHEAIDHACKNGECIFEEFDSSEVNELLSEIEKNRIFLAEDVIYSK